MGFYVFNCVHKFDIFSLGHVKQASGKGHSPHSVVVCTVFAFVIVVAAVGINGVGVVAGVSSVAAVVYL